MQLLALAQDREVMPADYEASRQNAIAVLNAWLAQERSTSSVSARPSFCLGSKNHGPPHTAATWLRFVLERAAAGCLTDA